MKNNVAVQCFVKMVATLIAEFFMSDKEDKLLIGINKLRNE